MPLRRSQIALTPAEREEFLRTSHTIIFITNDRRGYPLPVAMWYEVDPDGSVVMTTFRKSEKVKNLEHDPRCSLLIETGRTYAELKGLIIRGRAQIDPDTEHVLDLLGRVNLKYNNLPNDGSLREVMRGQASKRCLVRVIPEHISSWDHAKLGGRY